MPRPYLRYFIFRKLTCTFPLGVISHVSSHAMGACATSTGVFNNYALVPVNQGDSGGCVSSRMPTASRATDSRTDDVAR